MELAVNEFIINWHLSNIDDEKQVAESIIRLVKMKCHRLVFDHAYLDRFAQKLSDVERVRRGDTYVLQVLVKRLRILMVDSAKVRVCEGRYINELETFEEQDRLVIKSALCVEGEKKLLITTDSDLIQKAKALEKYRIEILRPEQAEELLASS